MMNKKYFFWIGAIVLGALLGWSYWYWVGCSSGSCPITSVWYNSTAYGAILGGLLAFPDKKRKI